MRDLSRFAGHNDYTICDHCKITYYTYLGLQYAPYSLKNEVANFYKAHPSECAYLFEGNFYTLAEMQRLANLKAFL
jgi:hypothetical protein